MANRPDRESPELWDQPVTSWAQETARVEFRPDWVGVHSPWRHLAALKAGENWFDLPEPEMQSQSQIDVRQVATPPIHPAAMAARELLALGATEPIAIENWLWLGVMSHELKGVARQHRIWRLTEDDTRISGKLRSGGFPDVVAFWPDGRVSVCEVKVRWGDRLNSNQLNGVWALRELLGDRLDLRVFEWLGKQSGDGNG